MRSRLLTILSSAFLASAIVSSRAASIDLPKYGFTMDVLDAVAPPDSPAQAVVSFLPAQDGFAPNVNVVIQPFPGTIKDYVSLSKAQFEEMKWSIISERTASDTEWIAEYSGSMQQTSLHWYARAILKSGKVYLVTATASESAWKTVADSLRKSVDSFQLK